MGRPSSVSSQQTTMPTSMSSRQTTDYVRGTSQLTNTSYATSFTQGTMDHVPTTSGPSFQDGAFSSNFGDFMSLDMQARHTPESTSTAASSQRNPYPSQPLNIQNPVNKLDSLMFPSEDPFAYPNQPMMELGYPGKSDPPSSVSDQGGQDMQLFLTGTFDDVESQIFGQPPPYMMHQQGQPVMNLSNQMFDPGMMGMQASPSHPMVPHQRHPQAQGQSSVRGQHPAHLMASRRAHTQRHQERQIQQMFTEQGMQADWGSFFGSGRGGFQGM